MRITGELIKIFCEEAMVDKAGAERGLQAVLDHLFPEPGTNPLAVCAPDRESPALRNLRGVLLQAEHAETALRESLAVAVDPEHEEILTAVTSVRRLLTPWATRGWESRYDER